MEKVLEFKDVKVTIEQCESWSIESPREDDNLGQCLFFHKRYNFKEDTSICLDSGDYNSFEEMENDLIKNHNVVCILPVYMYDHSGIAISTKPFGCRWDSGQLGFIVATREDIREVYSLTDKQRITKKIKEKVYDILRAEIDLYDQYLRGDVYRFSVEEKDADGDWSETDCCGGFYGDEADNGMFENMDIGITFEEYEKAYDEADWE